MCTRCTVHLVVTNMSRCDEGCNSSVLLWCEITVEVTDLDLSQAVRIKEHFQIQGKVINCPQVGGTPRSR